MHGAHTSGGHGPIPPGALGTLQVILQGRGWSRCQIWSQRAQKEAALSALHDAGMRRHPQVLASGTDGEGTWHLMEHARDTVSWEGLAQQTPHVQGNNQQVCQALTSEGNLC